MKAYWQYNEWANALDYVVETPEQPRRNPYWICLYTGTVYKVLYPVNNP